MGRRLVFVACVLFGALLLGCAPVPVAQDNTGIRGKSMIVVTKIIQDYRSVIFANPQSCGNADCSVDITLAFPLVDGKEVCVATIPPVITFTDSVGGAPKTITWNVITGGRIIEFHSAHGILVVDDAKSQIKPDNARTGPVTFSATNRHNAKGSATYVPVILFRPTATESAHVCATGDPQIIND